MLSLYLIAAIAGVGALLYLEHRSYLRRKAAEEYTEKPVETPQEVAGTEADNEECCGMHITCERDSLLAAVSEELDRHAGRQPESYSDDEIEEFRDILITMRPEDIAGWARSLQLRNIALPQAVRDELIMIVAEARSAAVHNA
mgnify:CR=1 FL=1